jgi:uncharacterized membrane protein YfcA
MSWNSKWSATRWSRQDRARVVQGLVFGVLGIAGAYVASRLSATVAPAALLAAFSVLMLAVAAMMVACRRAQLRAAAAGEVETGSPVGPVLQLRPTLVCDCPRVLKVVAVASAVGLLTGFFGVGGGFVVVPAFVLALGFTMPVVVGTSLLVIAIKSTSALLSRMGHGVHLDWPLIGGFTLAATVGSLLGGRLATRVRPQRLTAAFTMLLVAVAQYTAARSFPQLL